MAISEYPDLEIYLVCRRRRYQRSHFSLAFIPSKTPLYQSIIKFFDLDTIGN